MRCEVSATAPLPCVQWADISADDTDEELLEDECVPSSHANTGSSRCPRHSRGVAASSPDFRVSTRKPLRDLHSLTFEDDLNLDGLHGLPECLEGSSARRVQLHGPSPVHVRPREEHLRDEPHDPQLELQPPLHSLEKVTLPGPRPGDTEDFQAEKLGFAPDAQSPLLSVRLPQEPARMTCSRCRFNIFDEEIKECCTCSHILCARCCELLYEHGLLECRCGVRRALSPPCAAEDDAVELPDDAPEPGDTGHVMGHTGVYEKLVYEQEQREKFAALRVERRARAKASKEQLRRAKQLKRNNVERAAAAAESASSSLADAGVAESASPAAVAETSVRDLAASASSASTGIPEGASSSSASMKCQRHGRAGRVHPRPHVAESPIGSAAETSQPVGLGAKSTTNAAPAAPIVRVTATT